MLKEGSYRVVGLWHTHPNRSASSGPEEGGYPWVGDVGVARKMGLRVYTGRGTDFVDRV